MLSLTIVDIDWDVHSQPQHSYKQHELFITKLAKRTREAELREIPGGCWILNGSVLIKQSVYISLLLGTHTEIGITN